MNSSEKSDRKKKKANGGRKFMLEAINEAVFGVEAGDGGPFGAVIVRKGKLISKAHNMVIALNDPTAHAEVLAIRKACQKIKSFSLRGCEIYSTCEPCPMCLSAIHWARIDKIYYGCTRSDAEKIAFDDKILYDILSGKDKSKLKTKKMLRKECLRAFNLWSNKTNKVVY